MSKAVSDVGRGWCDFCPLDEQPRQPITFTTDITSLHGHDPSHICADCARRALREIAFLERESGAAR